MKLAPLPQSEFISGVSEGIFDLDFDAYKNDSGINASALKKIIRSMKFWHASKLQPKEQTEDMLIGTLVHLGVLEPHRFGDGKSHYFKPTTYKDAKTGEDKKWNGNAKVCQEWLENHADLPAISSQIGERVYSMKKAILDDEMAAEFLTNGHREVSLFCADPVTGERRKARLDVLCRGEDAVYIGDIKKMEDVDDEIAVNRTFTKWRYYLQFRFYYDLLDDLLSSDGTPPPVIRALAGCIEDSIAPELVWWEMDEDGMIEGSKQWRKAIDRYHFSKINGTVPGYDKALKIRKLHLNAWRFKNEE